MVTLRKLLLCTAAGIAAAAAVSCHPTKDLRLPDTGSLPESYFPENADSAATHVDSLNIAMKQWWEIFNDPALQDLIERAITRNRTLLEAAERVEEVRLLYGIAKADFYPTARLTVEGQRETKWEHPSKVKSGGAPVEERQVGNYSPDPQIAIKLNVGWEFNLWGKLTWAKRQAAGEFEATIEDERAMRMEVVAQVASAYFRLIALENEYAIVQSAMDNRRESMEKARLRFEGG